MTTRRPRCAPEGPRAPAYGWDGTELAQVPVHGTRPSPRVQRVPHSTEMHSQVVAIEPHRSGPRSYSARPLAWSAKRLGCLQKAGLGEECGIGLACADGLACSEGSGTCITALPPTPICDPLNSGCTANRDAYVCYYGGQPSDPYETECALAPNQDNRGDDEALYSCTFVPHCETLLDYILPSDKCADVGLYGSGWYIGCNDPVSPQRGTPGFSASPSTPQADTPTTVADPRTRASSPRPSHARMRDNRSSALAEPLQTNSGWHARFTSRMLGRAARTVARPMQAVIESP